MLTPARAILDLPYHDYRTDLVLHSAYVGLDIAGSFHENCSDRAKPSRHTHERSGHADRAQAQVHADRLLLRQSAGGPEHDSGEKTPRAPTYPLWVLGQFLSYEYTLVKGEAKPNAEIMDGQRRFI